MKKLTVSLFLVFVILSQLVKAEIDVVVIMDKEAYQPGETININVFYSQAFNSSELTLLRPDGSIEITETIPTNISPLRWEYNYTLKTDSMNGTYVLNVKAFQEETLAADLNKTFEVLSEVVSKELYISPIVINETTTKKIFVKTVSFENFGDVDINVNKIEISGSLKNIASVIQRPYLIPVKDSSVMKIKIDATNLVEGSYDSVINVSFDGAVKQIYINLEVVPFIEPIAEPTNGIQNYSYIIWYFAIGIVVVIIVLTIIAYRRRKKRKKKKEEKKEKEEIYYKPEEEYRTEYY